MKLLLVALYNLMILAGTAYLVQVYEWSAWWFMLAVLLLVSYKSKEE
mgnify:CR=1 FL=1